MRLVMRRRFVWSLLLNIKNDSSRSIRKFIDSDVFEFGSVIRYRHPEGAGYAKKEE